MYSCIKTPTETLIPFLWTMKTEFLGSVITIFYLYIEDAIPFRNVMLVVCLVLCIVFEFDACVLCIWHNVRTLAALWCLRQPSLLSSSACYDLHQRIRRCGHQVLFATAFGKVVFSLG